MKTVGITAEFNPFHNGHKVLIDAVRETMDPDGIVCIMSGNFVQRGYPAVCDKWARARAAVSCGADLVIELPTVYALSSAQDFAYGSMRIMKALGVTDFTFGSETGDITELSKIASINTDNEAAVKEALSKGLSYPRALSEALGIDLDPNDILGIEYLKNAGEMTPHVIKRRGMGHIATASYIRDNMAELEEFVPEDALYELQESEFWNEEADARLFQMLRYALLMKPAYELADIMGVSEGLENALKKAIDNAKTIDDIIMNAKSKRYTYARISRALMCIALDIPKSLKDEAKEAPLYARVLAMNERGAGILKNADAEKIEILSNLKKTSVMIAPYKDVLECDIQASDLYSILMGRRVAEQSDFVKNPRMQA